MKHPECGKDEFFLTNTFGSNFEKIGWKTKRKGKIAYDHDGIQINDDNFFPVFVKVSEVEEKPSMLKWFRKINE